MSRHKALRRGAPPLKPTGAIRLAPWIIAPMAYLATLALALALLLADMAGGWRDGLTGALTVELPPAAEAADSAARVAAALAVLEGAPGVREARRLSREEVAELIEPLLGGGLPAGELPLPTLIAVTADPAARPDRDALREALDDAVPGALLVDHATWLGDLARAAAAVRGVLAGVVSLTALAAAATVVLVTSAGMSIHRRLIELLHIMGASDRHVAGLFQRQALIAGAAGGGVGCALALATLAGLAWAAGSGEAPLLATLGVGGWWWLPLLAVPVGAALLAMLTARVTVLITLARMP
jgi:cell division transport system permease protein